MHNSEVVQNFLARQLKNGSPLAFQLPVQIAPIHSIRKKYLSIAFSPPNHLQPEIPH